MNELEERNSSPRTYKAYKINKIICFWREKNIGKPFIALTFNNPYLFLPSSFNVAIIVNKYLAQLLKLRR